MAIEGQRLITFSWLTFILEIFKNVEQQAGLAPRPMRDRFA